MCGVLVFLIYTLSGEHSLPLELPEVKRKYSFDFETSQTPSCHCIPSVKEYGIHIAFKCGGRFSVLETIKFGFKSQLMHQDKKPQCTAGEWERLPGQAFILEVIAYFTWLWLSGMRSLKKGFLIFTSLSIRWCGPGLCVSRAGDIYLNRGWRVDEP